MSPFKPAGERARWRVLYDLLAKLNVGDVLTYAEMGAALQLDPEVDRHTMQLAMRRAARELETVDKHAVDPIPNEGYRIVEPEGHIGLARRHQRKSSRSLARGLSKVENIDYNGMSPELRRVAEVTASALAAQMDFNRRMDIRQRNLEKAVDSVAAKAERTDDELADLKARLARLEGKQDPEQ